MKVKKYLFVLGVIILNISSLNAQINQSINVLINPVINLTTVGNLLLDDFDSEFNIENGLISSAVIFTVKSNILWRASTEITSITSTPIETIAPLTPSNISWGVGDGSIAITLFTPFASTINVTTTIKIGQRGSGLVTGNTFTLQYKIKPGYLIAPSTYIINVTHTITAY